MYDKPLVIDILLQISDAIETIESRFEPINSVDDFTDSPFGKEKLDSICMVLVAIGESLKNIDKITDNQLLCNYPHIDWKGAKGMRDIIAHHYFDIDADEIYYVCDTKLETLHSTIETMIKDLQK
ncbi:MAG: DUF86 domain-containing protein [Campylobacterales bacterium]|nr:DUF86 domain-containing protein [Campylobacterales bacterium]